MIRSGRSTSSSIIGKITDSSVVVLSVQRFSDGWHNVILEDETNGYVKFDTSYLEEIDDITNCTEEVTVLKNDVILRAGPGFSNPEITYLDKGQIINRIDNTGRYNIDGKVWDRVILSDSRQGFVPRDNIQKIDYSESFYVDAEGGIYLRESPAGEVIRKIPNGSVVTRLEAGPKVGDYTWDKVITEDGVIGYVAREYLVKVDGSDVPDVEENKIVENNTSVENNVIEEINVINNVTQDNEIEEENNVIENEVVTNNVIEENIIIPDNTISSNNVVIPDNSIVDNEVEDGGGGIETERVMIVEPSANADSISGAVITRGDKVITGNTMIATGDIATIGNIKYTIVKKGDCNGDGYVKANDYLIIKDYIMGTGTAKLEGPYKSAADVTGDHQVKANDYLKIKDHIMYGINM